MKSNKMSFKNATKLMKHFAKKGITCKMAIVFNGDSFSKPMEQIALTYITDNTQLYFHSKKNGALYGDALDGSDEHVRIDWLIQYWKVDYCYML